MYIVIELLAISLVVATGSDRHVKNAATISKDRLKNVIPGSDQYVNSAIIGSDQYIQSVLGTKVTIKPGRHVCTTEKVVAKPVKVTQTYKKPVYISHPRDCANFNNCPQFDVKYENTNRTVFLLQKYSLFRHSCCPGWTKGSKRQKGCMAPICTNGCGDFGVCIKPEVCECPRGFKGDLCDRDIDECQSNDHGCQQMCKNTAGSYMCACHTGFSLAEDGKTCNYCYKCQKEYTDMVLSVENMKKSMSDSFKMQTEHVQIFTSQQNIMMDRMVSLEQEIRNLTDENRRLETVLSDIQGNFEMANKEIERLQNITRATEAPPTTPTTSQSATTTQSTTPAATTTESAVKDQGLEFSLEDLLYSLSNQIGMMEEKLELCNCRARLRP